MRKYLIPVLIILSVLLTVLEIVLYVIKKDDSLSTIYIEINPSLEITFDKDNIVKSVKALNDDAKEVIENDLEGKEINDVLSHIVDKIIDKGYVKDNQLTMIVHVSGSIDNGEAEHLIKNNFGEKNINVDTIFIDKVSKEDEEFAKENNISPYKAALINSIKEDNENIDIEELIDKPINDINQTKLTGNTCDDGYFLEGDFCFKEIERKEAKTGSVCPGGYFDYNGKCYEEKPYNEGTNLICNEDFDLVNGTCIKKITDKPTGVCNDGNYDGVKDVCHENVYIGDAYEYCRDPGRTLYDHKCLATKPTINGGCLNGDMLYSGKCVNTRNDYYASEWMCPNGKTNSTDTGELIFQDNKCYEEKAVKPTTYECNSGFSLEGDICVREETQEARKERICPSGFTMVPYDRCINMNNVKDYESGFVCEEENSRPEGNMCVIYEVVEAKHNS